MDQTFEPSPRPTLLPPVIRILLIVNVAVFFLQPYFRELVLGHLVLWPVGAPDTINTPGGALAVGGFAPWQLITYAFLHGNLTHLMLNMFALWMFGVALEHTWGSARFAFYYFVCVVGAALVQLLVTLPVIAGTGGAPTLGASGGVFGILLAFGVMFPEQRILLLFPPIPIKAKWFVLIYGIVELVFGVTGTMSGVAHFAHLGGMVFGLILILMWRRNRDLPPL